MVTATRVIVLPKQAEIVRRTGLSRATVYRIFSGQVCPTRVQLQRIAELCGAIPEELDEYFAARRS